MDDIKKIIKTAFVQEADRTLKELKEEDTLRLSTEDKDAMRRHRLLVLYCVLPYGYPWKRDGGSDSIFFI